MTERTAFFSRPRLDALLLAAAASVYAWVAVRCAWLCDDAFITFRTVDNWLSGHGLRWNVAERVQSYTHPLWMLLVSAGHAVTGEFYYTVLAISLVCSGAAVAWLGLRVATGRRAAWVAILVLGLSKAFVDYSTSGLENPLSFLLVALFAGCVLDGRRDDARLLALSLLASLALVNRMDLLLLLAPGWILAGVERGSARGWLVLAAGSAPFLAWEVFSIVYYGFPFPNTAYAKLATDLPASILWVQGLRYLQNSLVLDPITLAAIAAGLWGAAWRRRPRELALAAGVAFYLVYVVRIGGDFMSGRHLSVPLFASACLIARWPIEGGRRAAPLAALALGLGFLAPHPVWRSGAGYGVEQKPVYQEFGIGDERAYYFPHTGLLTGRPRPVIHPWLAEGREIARRGRRIASRTTVGFYGFGAGPGVHVIDLYALGEPLLARLPARDHAAFRIGHHFREFPEGYPLTLREGENRIENPDLAAYYDALRRITRGPLFDAARWRDIVAMNLGLHGHRIDAYLESLEDREERSGGDGG